MDEIKGVDNEMLKNVIGNFGSQIDLLVDNIYNTYVLSHKRQARYILEQVFRKLVQDSRTEKFKKLAEEYGDYFDEMFNDLTANLTDFVVEQMVENEEEDEIDRRGEAFFNDRGE